LPRIKLPIARRIKTLSPKVSRPLNRHESRIHLTIRPQTSAVRFLDRQPLISTAAQDSMNNFLITSIVGSILLTLLLNLLPLLFPNQAAGLQRKMEEHARRSIEQHEDQNQPRVKVFFPWKAMIVISIILTVLVNLVGFFTG
jgi:hypothetical protein